LRFLEHVKPTDFAKLGILKRGHRAKLARAIVVLSKLLFQGRKPQEANEELQRIANVRETIKDMRECPLHESITTERLVYSDEESFWMQMRQDKLNPAHDNITNVVGLKDGLHDLRNTAMIVLIMSNSIWIALMLLLTSSASVHLNLLGTNPLGLLFLIVYGGLFVIQFITLVWHRAITFVHLIAGVTNTEVHS